MWQQNAYGFRAGIDTRLDLIEATSVWVKIARPSGSFVERLIPVVDITNSVDGVVSVPILDGDLTELGDYHIQVIDKTPGRFIPSSIVKFSVEANL